MKGCFLAGTKVLTDSGRKNIEDIKVGDLVLSRDDKTGAQGFKPVVHLEIARKADQTRRAKLARKATLRDHREARSQAEQTRPASAVRDHRGGRSAPAKARVRGRTARRSHVSARPRRAASSSSSEGDSGDASSDDDADSGSAGDGADPDPGSGDQRAPALGDSEAALERSASLRCTTEHPFFVRGRGWVGAGRLQVGDELISDRGEPLLVVAAETRCEPADHFNFEVEDWHTYFVAETEVDPGVWVHNMCKVSPPKGPKPPRHTPAGNKWRYQRYRSQGGMKGFDDWMKVSHGGRSGGPGHQAIQSHIDQTRGLQLPGGKTTEVGIGPSRVADNAGFNPTTGRWEIHQIGGVNPVRGDPIARERGAINDILGYLRSRGTDEQVDIIFWNKRGGTSQTPVVNPHLLPNWGG